MSSVLDHSIELEKLLLNHDIMVFGYERVGDLAVVRFTMNEKKLRLVVAMPDWNSAEFRLTPSTNQIRSAEQRKKLYWAEVSRRWRAMRNLIAAKLEGIEAGITTFEAEFTQFEDAAALLGAGAESPL